MNTFYNIITKLTGGGWQFLTLIIIFALIIISILIIFNYKNIKKRKLTGEKEFQNILIYRLKRINILRDKGVISKEDFENRENNFFNWHIIKKDQVTKF